MQTPHAWPLGACLCIYNIFILEHHYHRHIICELSCLFCIFVQKNNNIHQKKESKKERKSPAGELLPMAATVDDMAVPIFAPIIKVMPASRVNKP